MKILSATFAALILSHVAIADEPAPTHTFTCHEKDAPEDRSPKIVAIGYEDGSAELFFNRNTYVGSYFIVPFPSRGHRLAGYLRLNLSVESPEKSSLTVIFGGSSGWGSFTRERMEAIYLDCVVD